MLADHLRRWPNIVATLAERLMFAVSHSYVVCKCGFVPTYRPWAHLYLGWCSVSSLFGHCKVISRSQKGQISTKRLKIAYFGCFC